MRLIDAQFRRVPSAWFIVVLWLLLTIPGIFIRGAHYEEGATIGLARGAFEDGHWISPYLYGMRFVESPVLISWLLAGVALMTGHIDLWMARLPEVLSILSSACLLYWLVRRYASVEAALFSGASFLVSPMMLQKIITAEPDSVVSALLFATLVIWWIGFENGGTRGLRWFGIAAILSVTTLLKGPLPLGYFFLGLGAYLILKREWLELLKVAVAGIIPTTIIAAWHVTVFQVGDIELWLSYSRLSRVPELGNYLWHVVRFCFFVAIESLPALLLVIPAAFVRRPQPQSKATELSTLLPLYAATCTIALAFWPGGANGRYAMPGFIAIAAYAGLAFDDVRRRHPIILRCGILIGTIFALYGIGVNCVAMPIRPDRFREKAEQGRSVTRVVGRNLWPVYVTPETMNTDLLIYIRTPVRIVSANSMLHVQPPFWVMMLPNQAADYRVARQNLSIKAQIELLPNIQLLEVKQE